MLAGGIHDYAQGGERPVDYWLGAAEMSRTDLQPHVLEAVRRGSWTFWQFLQTHNRRNLMRYQGGPEEKKDAQGNVIQEDRSGQIAAELLPATKARGAILVTTELDLLLAGETDTELLDVDTKSGNKVWTSGDVKESFQFRTHAWLIFANYPDVEQVHVRIFMPRMYGEDNQWSPTVTFTRRSVDAHEGRLLTAVEDRRQMFALADEVRENELLSDVADGSAGVKTLVGAMDVAAKARGFKYAWPLPPDKCVQCPAAQMCPHVLYPAFQVHDDPIAYAKDTDLIEIALMERKETLFNYVEKHGNIHEPTTGYEWGVKPKAIRKPTKAQYGGFYRAANGAPVDGDGPP